MNLDPKQQDVIDDHEGIILVDAGAGTGKTLCITRRFISVYKKLGSYEDIILLTFTRAAARQMKVRIADELGKSVQDIADARIGTFDSFCLQLLREYGTQALRHIGIQDTQLLRSLTIIGNDVVASRIFRQYWTRLDLSKYKAIQGLIQYPETIRGFLDLLASRGIFPGEHFSISGTFEEFRASGMNAAALSEKTGKPVKNAEVTKYNAWLGQQEARLAGDEWQPEKDDKSLPWDRLEEAFNEDRALLLEFLEEMYRGYIRFLAERGQMTYSITRLLAFVLLIHDEAVRNRVRASYVMIDEFQDTDSIQMMIALLVCSRNLCCVGDWKQGIYGWRNAEVENITQFRERLKRFSAGLLALNSAIDLSWTAQEVKAKDLTRNFRSFQQILDLSKYAFALDGPLTDGSITLGDGRVVIALDAHKEGAAEIGFFTHEDEGAAIAAKILELQKKDVALKDIAVLCRSWKLLNSVAEALERLRIPHAMASQQGVYRGEAAVLTLAWMRLLVDAEDSRGLAVVAEQYGVPDTHIASFRNPPFLDELRAVKPLHALPLAVARHHGLSGEAFTQAAVISQTLADFEETLTVSLPEAITLLEGLVEDDSEESYEYAEQEEAVNLLTIHGAKGLEWDAVFVAGVKRSNFPGGGGGGIRTGPEFTYDPAIGIRCSDVYRDEQLFPNWRTRMLRICLPSTSEEERLLYVALTRAKRFLYVSTDSKPSNYYRNLLERCQELTVGGEIQAEPLAEPVNVKEKKKAELPVLKFSPLKPVRFIPATSLVPITGGGEGDVALGTAIHEYAQLKALGRNPKPVPGAEQACRNIDAFLKGKEIIGVEIPCLLPIPEKNVVITGIIDLLYRDKETKELVVVDYKTGAFHDEYKWQLSVYGWCAGTENLVIFNPLSTKTMKFPRASSDKLSGRMSMKRPTS